MAPERVTPTGPELWEAWCAHLKRTHHRPETITEYRRVIYHFWRYCKRMNNPAAVTKRDLEKFLGRYSERGPSAGRPISAITARNGGKIITLAYRWFTEEGLIGKRRSPLAGYGLPKAHEPPPRFLEQTTIGRLVMAAEQDDARMATMLWLGYGCGLRRGEIARLKVEDVTPARGQFPMVLDIDGKGGKKRRVPVHGSAAAWLEGYLATRPRTGPLLAKHPRTPSHLTPRGHLTPGSVGDMMADFMRAHGVKESSHALRHTFATELLMANPGQLRGVQRLLGHASSVTTERYTAAYDGQAWTVASTLPDPRTGK
jgi:integrase/recombinase XerD